MDYRKIYNEDYFSGKDSFFYKLGYGRFTTTYFNNLFKPVGRYIDEVGAGNVLDIGCGYGFMLQRFPDSFRRFGIDISEHAVDTAKKRLSASVFKVGGAEDKLPFDEEFFDIVLMNDVIEHLENPKLALENILRILKKDGILYITTPNLNTIRRKIFRYPDKKEHHVSLFPHPELCKLLGDIGFNVIEHWTSLTCFICCRFKSGLGTESAFICKK